MNLKCKVMENWRAADLPRFSVILIKLLVVAIAVQKKMLILFDFDARLGSQPLYNFCIFTYITYICLYN